MLANGYQNNHLAFYFKKISLMMISIGIVSCLVSSGVLKIISFLIFLKDLGHKPFVCFTKRVSMVIYVIFLLSFGIYRARNFIKSIYSFKDEKIKMYECLRRNRC